jgi:chaperonin cofactor prefoldin
VQLQKKKEELEFELDLLEKNIARVNNKIKEQTNY